MTLCLAWKVNGDIHFASDSRISRKIGYDYLTVSDTAPKIFSIPLRIYKSDLNLLYDNDWGMCLAGGYITGSGYADTLSEVLSNLQIADSISIIDYKNILNIAFDIYEQISKQLVETGNKEALAKILITGVCPNDKNRDFLFEFGYKLNDFGITYYSKEIDFNEYFIYAIGDNDAMKYFNENLKKTNSNDYFRLLKTICKSSDFKTVGGHLQAGILKKTYPKHFSIYGIVESELEFDGEINWTVKINWFFRSIELKPQLFEGNIHVRKIFLSPFEKERNDMFEEAIKKSELELEQKLKRDKKTAHNSGFTK